MEVLQTSALPLGDGAGWKRSIETGVVRPRLCAATTAGARAGAVGHKLLRSTFAVGLPTEAHASVAMRERRLERETGFEPATSTLARSHSTTELFPPATKPKRTTRVSAESRQPSRP